MEDTQKDIGFHLVDLRNLLLKIGVFWLIGTAIAFWRGDFFVNLITSPLNGQELHFLSPTDSFFFLLKIYFFFGFLIVLPIVIYFIWQYTRPILRSREKKFILNYILFGVGLATIAILYGYYWLIPASLKVLLGIQPEGTNILLTAQDYLDFTIGLGVVILLIFQLPLVVYCLIKSKIVEASFFQQQRKVVYFGLITLMAILTPTPDALSLILITVPVLILYEIALALAKL